MDTDEPPRIRRGRPPTRHSRGRSRSPTALCKHRGRFPPVSPAVQGRSRSPPAPPKGRSRSPSAARGRSPSAARSRSGSEPRATRSRTPRDADAPRLGRAVADVPWPGCTARIIDGKHTGWDCRLLVPGSAGWWSAEIIETGVKCNIRHKHFVVTGEAPPLPTPLSDDDAAPEHLSRAPVQAMPKVKAAAKAKPRPKAKSTGSQVMKRPSANREESPAPLSPEVIYESKIREV